MKTHSDIIASAGGAAVLSRKLKIQGVLVEIKAVQRWKDRNCIPGAYWLAMVGTGHATFFELARGVAVNAD
jgi:hypothetical protein